MRSRSAALLGMILMIAACKPAKSQDVDPMGAMNGVTAMPRTLTCNVTAADGQCLKKTCKQDAEGDCETYAGYCIGAGEHWSGTKEGGTCTKVL